MRFTLKIVIVLSIYLCLAACGTFIGRTDPVSVEGEYYNSTKGGLLLLGLNNSGGEADGAAVMCWMVFVCPFITVVSLPLDIAIDTLFLPFDVLNSHDKKQL